MQRRIVILMAVDESYAAPLCVTVMSLLAHLGSGVALDLYVMESGLTADTRRALTGAWDDRVTVHWVEISSADCEALSRHGYMTSPAANFRLLAGSRLPRDVIKVLYLDADLLVLKDVVLLWDRDMKGKIVLAAQDSYVQGPVAVGGATMETYFNSGVMLIDLEAWRAARIEEACLEAAARHRHRTKWLDQHVLNLCLAGRWGTLPPVWNKQFTLDLFPDWRCSPYGEKDFMDARRDPAIIHFCTRTKPWHPVCDHSRVEVLAYRAVLERSPWRQMFPERLSPQGRFLEFFAAPHRRLLDIAALVARATGREHAFRAMLPRMAQLAVRHPWTIVSVPLSAVSARGAMMFARMRSAP